MSNRTIYIGAFTLGFIQGAASKVDRARTERSVAVERAVYASLLQAGAEAFETPVPHPADHLPSSIQRRFRSRYRQTEGELHALVTRTLEPYFQFADPLDPRGTELWHLTRFLAEVLLAARHGFGVALHGDSPDLTGWDDVVAPEMFVPLANVLSAFQTVTPTVFVPRSTIGSETLKIFEEILASDLYRAYEDAHQELTTARDLPSVVRGIGDRAKAIVRKYPRAVRAGRAVASVMPLMSGVIEAVLGKVPASAADLCGKIVEAASRNSGVVVYHLGGVIDYVVPRQPVEEQQ